jgi:sugar phosphate isomerase/epimerase
MRLTDTSHLTYCMNIHPGEAWEDQRQAIAGEACAVKAALAPDRPFGLGLRLSRRAIDTLDTPAARDDLRGLLAERGLYVFTVNAFPYGPFHGQPVKTNVYTPNWSQRERLDYTLRVAELLAGLLPDGVEGSVSTVPIAYKDPPLPTPRLVRVCEQLADAAFALHALEARTGRLIHLGLEPEPDCLIETTPACIAFFDRSLLPLGTAWLRRHQGLTAQQAGQILHRHIGVCFDTCHLAMAFESLPESLQALHRHGIRISKVQLSAALETQTTQQAVYTLFPFSRDKVYLHQVKIRLTDGTLDAWRDLTPERLTTWTAKTPRRPCRVHFHVPLDFTGAEGLSSTAALLTPTFYATARQCGVRHFEIETYTLAVLPPPLQQRSLVDSILAEYRHVLAAWTTA